MRSPLPAVAVLVPLALLLLVPIEVGSAPPNSTPLKPAPPAILAHASLPLRMLRLRIHPNMSLTELRVLMGFPDHTRIVFDANDRTGWDYDALDGRIELIVAPRDGWVKWVEVRPSLALTRSCVRVGRTLAQAQTSLSAAMSAQDFRGLEPFHGGQPSRDPTHELWATDGTLHVWVDTGTGRIRRVMEDRHLVMGRRVP